MKTVLFDLLTTTMILMMVGIHIMTANMHDLGGV